MKCGDKVLFIVMDTGRAGCLIVIRNTEEKLYYGDVTIKKAMLKEANNMLHGKNLLRGLPLIVHTKHNNIDITYGVGTITALSIQREKDIRDEYNHITGEIQSVLYGSHEQPNVIIRANQARGYEIETDINQIQIRQIIAFYNFRTGSTMQRDILTYYFDNDGYTTQIERKIE